jgi:hypothetical protein
VSTDDDEVMPIVAARVTVCDMVTEVRTRTQITSLVLEEFRLRSPDLAAAAARVAASFSGIEPTVPLLRSIDDPHDVAVIWALHSDEATGAVAAQRNKLDHLVASWRPLKHYEPRVTERTESPPSYYRLAVTESGINTDSPAYTATPRKLSDVATTSPLGLLWIGSPLGTHAGLLILLGDANDANDPRPDPRAWPLPLSRYLGVRIYASVA